MATISIVREHRLPVDEVRSHVEALAEKFARELDASCQWEGDVMRFKRSGASGSIGVKGQEVEVDVDLGMMLRPFKARIEQSINDYLDETFS